MPRYKKKVPKLHQHHRGGAFVKVNGETIWLGRYGDPLTQERYDRLIAQWLANGRRLPEQAVAEGPGTTVTDVVLAYFDHVEKRYDHNTVENVRKTIREARRLFGTEPAASFGPKRLRIVRDQFKQAGLSRQGVNRQVRWLRAMFKWAASHEMVPYHVYEALTTVEALKRGEAPESAPVRPVPRAMVRSVRHRLPRQVRAMIDLQLLTGARPAELLTLRATDLKDTGRQVWRYVPTDHKTAHHGKGRVLYFGPKAQRILRQFMGPGRSVERPLFSPKDAQRERHAQAETHRRANQKPNPRKTDRTIGETYTTASYRRAIHRACDEAFPPPEGTKGKALEQWRREHRWSPNQLRHNAATDLRRRFGAEVASVVLGHSSAKLTDAVYAERDERKAADAIGRVG